MPVVAERQVEGRNVQELEVDVPQGSCHGTEYYKIPFFETLNPARPLPDESKFTSWGKLIYYSSTTVNVLILLVCICLSVSLMVALPRAMRDWAGIYFNRPFTCVVLFFVLPNTVVWWRISRAIVRERVTSTTTITNSLILFPQTQRLNPAPPMLHHADRCGSAT